MFRPQYPPPAPTPTGIVTPSAIIPADPQSQGTAPAPVCGCQHTPATAQPQASARPVVHASTGAVIAATIGGTTGVLVVGTVLTSLVLAVAITAAALAVTALAITACVLCLRSMANDQHRQRTKR